MKIEQKTIKVFQPITITLETSEEARVVWKAMERLYWEVEEDSAEERIAGLIRDRLDYLLSEEGGDSNASS